MSGPQTHLPPKTASKPVAEENGATSRSFEASRAQTEKAGRDTEAVIEKTADASRDAARANREILQRNAETAHEAVRSGIEAGAQSLHGLAENMSRSFGMMRPDPELAEQSARNIRAVSEASTALARGSQAASRAWFDLVQSGARANLEAFGELTGCRTIQDLTALQSRLARENLQRFIDSGELIAQATGQAISEASRAMDADSPGNSPRT